MVIVYDDNIIIYDDIFTKKIMCVWPQKVISNVSKFCSGPSPFLRKEKKQQSYSDSIKSLLK